MKKILFVLLISIPAGRSFAQIDAGLFRFPDVSATQIVFTYANDVWVYQKPAVPLPGSVHLPA